MSKYTHEFCATVNSKLPREVLECMAQYGWNPVGVYEMVQEERAAHRRWKLPVFVEDLQFSDRGVEGTARERGK